MSYKVEVIADGSGKWVSNFLRFATYDEAWSYGNELAVRWTAVKQMQVGEDDAPVNARWNAGKLEHL